jgi:hypothetical protein
MENITKKISVAVLVLAMIYGGLSANPIVKNVDYDAYIQHNGAYNGITTVGTGRGVGAWYRATPTVTLFQQRPVFKWDMSGIITHVNSAVITFNIGWTSLTDSLGGDITISTFTTASNGAVIATDGGWDGSTPISPTASKMAFASTVTGAQVVDVTDWVNAAIDAGLSNFCVRLDADYLFVEPALSALTVGSNPQSYIFGGGSSPATLNLVLPAVQAPVFSQTSPYVSGPTPITMTCTSAGATIYYTLNGSTPTSTSTLYSGPVTINAGDTLKAIAVLAGYEDSPVTSVSYFLLFENPVVMNVDYDGFVTHVDDYYSVEEHRGGGVYVGAWKRSDGVVFQQRTVFKWDLTGITLPVSRAEISIPVAWTTLTGSLMGNIGISTFTSATNGAVTSEDAFETVATASKVAFASTATESQIVDVTDWLNIAIGNGQTTFSVRLDADYLFVEPILSSLPVGTPISWINAGESSTPATLTYNDPSITITDSFADNNYTNNPTWFVLQQDSGEIGLESSDADPVFAADGSSVGNYTPAAGMLNFSPTAGANKRICLSFADMAQTAGVEVSFDLFQSNNAYPNYGGFCMELADSRSSQSYYTDGHLTTNYYGVSGGGWSGFRSYDASGTVIGGTADKSLLNGWRRMTLRFNPGSGVEMIYDGQRVAHWPNFKNLTRVDQLILYHTGTLSWFVDNVTARFTPTSDLSKGHQILVEKNLQIQGLSFGEPITESRFIESKLTGINRWVYPATSSSDQSTPMPSFIPQWGRCSNPANQNMLEEPEYNPNGIYLPRMVNYQYRDEVNGTNFSDLDAYKVDPSVDEGKVHLEAARTWFNTYRSICPDVILSTNQWDEQVSEEIMRKYMAVCQPDMVSFDQYYFRGSIPGNQNYKIYGGSPKLLYQYLQKYRLLGLGGNDGTGRLPIPYGLYSQTFIGGYVDNHTVSESEMRLNVFSAWAFGFKFVTNFIYMVPENYQANPSALFDGRYDTTPTPLFTLFANMNGESRNLGPALVRLLSTDVRMKMGRHHGPRTHWYQIGVGDWEEDNTLPPGISAWSTSADPYITSVSAGNPGNYNTYTKDDIASSWTVRLPGDVVLGFFKPLHESFDGLSYSNQKYFMIVNGLSDFVGNAYGCRQVITIDFNFGSSGINSLQRMRRSDGAVETITAGGSYSGLTFTSLGGSSYRLVLTFDGGTGDLFKYNTGAPFVGAGDFCLQEPIPGDANGDGRVDVGDLGILAANYGTIGTAAWVTGDFNGDKTVDVGDLGILAAHYGQGTVNSSQADFDADYAQAFGTIVVENTQEDETVNDPACSKLGLPLIAGLMLAGLLMFGYIKLEDQ